MQLPKSIIILLLMLISVTFCFSQDVTLSSQAEVDVFDPNTTTISGDLIIGSDSSGVSDIYDLSNLSNLSSISGNLTIQYNNILSNIDALSNLDSVGIKLNLQSNHALTNVDGFSNLVSIGTSLRIRENNVLSNVDGFSGLTSINWMLDIFGNNALTNIDGFSNLVSIGGKLNTTYNNTLSNVDGFSNLNSIGSWLVIIDNNSLLNIDGFSSLNSIGNDLEISNNIVLSNINGFSNLNSIGRNLTIQNNDALPNVDGFSNLNSIGNNLRIVNNNLLSNIDGFLSLNSIDALDIQNNNVLSNIDGFYNLNSSNDFVNIQNNDALSNVDGLSNLSSIGAYLKIQDNDALLNVDGFSNLTSINFSLFIEDNNGLLNINGFSNLGYTSGFSIQNNNSLSNINGFPNLTSIGNLSIGDNDILSNLDGLSNLTSVSQFLYIENNNLLSNVDGLSNLISIGNNLSIINNSALSNLNGFSNLVSIGYNLIIQDNQNLTSCCSIQNLLVALNTTGTNISISNNPIPCDSQITILDNDCGNNINTIEGNVFLDNDANCLFDQGDIPYEGIIVQANSYEYLYTTVTNSLGDYKFYLDTGSYEVKAFMANPYTQTCTSSFHVDILDAAVSDSFNFDFPTIVNTYCPYLEVDISSWALRECFDNNYYVRYCNSGTVDATNAYIELELDAMLSIASSSIPFTGPDMNNIYTFDVGTVNIGDCGQFDLNILLPCDSLDAGQFQGQTFCIDAHIYPDSICLPPLDIWDGSSIQVTGECDQDSVRFRVRNIGSGDMLSDKTLNVFEDYIMFTQNYSFQLQSGEEIILSYFANGSTFRLDAEQSEGHPGNSNPSVVVEACGAGPIFSLGFVNQFSQDDGDVFVSSECREVTGSYDPNDKQAFPTGYGEEHFIEKNTDIEYLIRFQNTGTDTAFTVVITDEISPLLDITTIQPGASSHPYIFEIDSVIRFTFNDILLVDSLTNEAASHGFVKFRISQQVDLPNGTLLENTAKIYFDFNAPIITNTTFHTIGENFITINLIDDIEDLFQISSIKAYPNPFSDAIHFELEGTEYKDVLLSVFDVNGRKVATKNYNASSTFQFDREDLSSGIYFYTISSEGIDIANGKMILR